MQVTIENLKLYYQLDIIPMLPHPSPFSGHFTANFSSVFFLRLFCHYSCIFVPYRYLVDDGRKQWTFMCWYSWL